MQMLTPKIGHSQAPFITAPAGRPAESSAIDWLSLDAYVSNGGHDTVYVRVDGDSMRDRDIHHGDILVVHLRHAANSGEAILARLGDTFTVKNFHELNSYERRRRLYLVPSNPSFNMQALNERDDFEIVGVVAFVVKRFQ